MEEIDIDFLETITSREGYRQLKSLWLRVGRDEERFIKIMEEVRLERLIKKKDDPYKTIPMF